MQNSEGLSGCCSEIVTSDYTRNESQMEYKRTRGQYPAGPLKSRNDYKICSGGRRRETPQ